MIRVFVVLFLLVSVNSVMASRFYMGANVGMAALDPSFTIIDTSLDPTVPPNANPGIPNVMFSKDYRAADDTSASGSVFVGYKLGKDIAIEFGYTVVSESEADQRPLDDGVVATDLQVNESVEIDFTHVAFIGLWPVADNWAMRARLGLANWDFNYSQALIDLNDVDFGRTEAYSDSGIDFFYGVGMSYGLSEKLELRADIDMYSFKPEFTNVNVESDMPLFSIGAIYHF